MRFRKGIYRGIWFLWPVVIYYIDFGIEIRYFRWFVRIDWDK